MKKTLLLSGMVLCLILIVGAFATSYYDNNSDRKIVADKAIKLSLGSSQEISSLILSEDSETHYSITTTVEKSASVNESDVNATLTITLTDTSETVKLDSLVFNIYKASDTDTVIVSSEDTGFNGSLVVSGINETTEYILEICLKAKDGGARYTPSELKAIGGKISIDFSSTTGGNA